LRRCTGFWRAQTTGTEGSAYDDPVSGSAAAANLRSALDTMRRVDLTRSEYARRPTHRFYLSELRGVIQARARSKTGKQPT
jgi:hypothetical protein